jgi:hypothetical protein
MIGAVQDRTLYAMSPSTDRTAGDGRPPPAWQQVQTLGLADVVITILRARKVMPLATAAAVSREKHDGGFRVHVNLLEGAPKNPDGNEGAVAIFVARELGKDLTDAFGSRDVIILQ